MIKKIPNYFSHSDDRGDITGIINTGTWEEMNFITSIAGTVRGGHYHKHTTEAFYILEGRVKINTRNIHDSNNHIHEETVHSGDFFIIEPFVLHTFTVVKDAKWLNLLSKKMNDIDKDFFRE